ncbi:MAG: PilZ domain-containing protein [Methylobacter sp.]
MFVERRLGQRIPVEVSVLVVTEDGVRIRAVAVDLSSGGLGLECSTKQRNLITPGGSFVKEGKPVSVFIDLNLAEQDGRVFKIEARCHVAFSRRLSSDQCKIGLRYVEIESGCRDWLAHFIEKAIAAKN